MQISMNLTNSNINFKGDFIYKGRYFPDKQDQTHDVIRAHYEEQLGEFFYYQDQLDKEGKFAIRGYEKSPNSIERKCETCQVSDIKSDLKKADSKVDVEILKNARLGAFRERRPNELYSGEYVAYQPEKIEALAKAGIKSVLCLVNYPEYKENLEKYGLKYDSLSTLTKTNLNVFDVNGDMIKELIRHPESYAQTGENTKIGALKKFVQTLNGDNPDMPLPMYFGCQLGTDRTFLWHRLYTILKDEDMTQPLSEETVQKLAEFAELTKDCFRW